MTDSKFTFGIGSFVKIRKRLLTGRYKYEAESGFIQETRGNDNTMNWKIFYPVTKKCEWVDRSMIFPSTFGSPSRGVLKRKAKSVLKNTKSSVRAKTITATSMKTVNRKKIYNDFFDPKKFGGVSTLDVTLASGENKEYGWWKKDKQWNRSNSDFLCRFFDVIDINLENKSSQYRVSTFWH